MIRWYASRMTPEQPDSLYEQLQLQLNRAEIPRSPANIHGRLAGYLAVGIDLRSGDWPPLLARDLGIVEGVAEELAGSLKQLVENTMEQFAMRDFSFRLLLPDDDAPLDERSSEIGQWCAGYIDSLRAFGEERVLEASDEVAEVLDDLEQIAGISDEIEESEESEVDFLELVEYVRLAVIDLFEEWNGNLTEETG